MRVIRAIIVLGCFYQHTQTDPISSDDDPANKMQNGTESVSEYNKVVTVTATPAGSRSTENNLPSSQDSTTRPPPSPKMVTSSGGAEPSSSTDFTTSTQILTTPASPTPGVKEATEPPQSSSTLSTRSTVTHSPVQTTKAMGHAAVLPVSSSSTAATTSISSKPSLTTKTMVHVTQKHSASTSGSVSQPATTRNTSATESTATASGLSATSNKAAHSSQKHFSMTFSTEDEREKAANEEDLYQICQKLMKNIPKAECTLKGHYGENKEFIFEGAVIQVSPAFLEEYYKDLKSTSDNSTLIIILGSCSALLAVIIALSIYAACHCRAHRKEQQHLTEELQTVENGYHDNPTLEVMEVLPEMQEKSALSAELNNSWIVPGNHKAKEAMPDEEDTHL